MAKRSKKKGSEKFLDKRKNQKKNLLLWIGAGIAVAIIILAFLGHMPFVSKGGKKGKSFYVQEGETRPVLPPSMFTGMTRAAYAAAKKYPRVMDEVFCYCTCDEPPFYHKSLLSCFVENHGAG